MFHDLTGDRLINERGEECPVFYGGVAYDQAVYYDLSAAARRSGNGIQDAPASCCASCCAFCGSQFVMLDLGLSALADTVLLPYSIPRDMYHARQQRRLLAEEQRSLGGPFHGEWIAEFHFEKNTAHPDRRPCEWLTFDVTLRQKGTEVSGRMRAPSPPVGGVVRGGVTNGAFVGTMRLSWDRRYWEKLELTLGPDAMDGEGRAIFRASEREQRFYRIRLRRKEPGSMY